jgi:glycosyltransferase involved in cell wall biosynthesis
MRSAKATILIPAKDESATISTVLTRVFSLYPDAEVLVVDDGSRDDTARLALLAGAQVISHPAPRGKGEALRTGFARASHEFIVTLDADGQDDPQDIAVLLAEAASGVDLVIGSRFLGRFLPGSISWVNYLATKAFNGLIFLRYGVRVTDSQAGVRCYRRPFLDRLDWYSTEFEVETELLVATVAAGGSIREVPVKRLPRSHGSTSFRRLRHGMRILRTILAGRAP